MPSTGATVAAAKGANPGIAITRRSKLAVSLYNFRNVVRDGAKLL
jgi:hypothetical protein